VLASGLLLCYASGTQIRSARTVNTSSPPGNPIDPSLGGAQVIHSDVEHDALQQLQDAAALQDAELTSQAATQAAAAAAAAQAARQADKLKRVAQACDACSQRKVKVSSEGALVRYLLT